MHVDADESGLGTDPYVCRVSYHCLWWEMLLRQFVCVGCKHLHLFFTGWQIAKVLTFDVLPICCKHHQLAVPHYFGRNFWSTASFEIWINIWLTNDHIVISSTDRATGLWLSVKFAHIGVYLIQRGVPACVNSHYLLRTVVGFQMPFGEMMPVRGCVVYIIHAMANVFLSSCYYLHGDIPPQR